MFCSLFVCLPGKEDVRDNSDGPEVACLVVLAREHLRRNVVRRADPSGHGRLHILEPRQAEVDDLHTGQYNSQDKIRKKKKKRIQFYKPPTNFGQMNERVKKRSLLPRKKQGERKGAPQLIPFTSKSPERSLYVKCPTRVRHVTVNPCIAFCLVIIYMGCLHMVEKAARHTWYVPTLHDSYWHIIRDGSCSQVTRKTVLKRFSACVLSRQFVELLLYGGRRRRHSNHFKLIVVTSPHRTHR